MTALRKLRILIALPIVLLGFSLNTIAQNVEFKVSAPRVVEAGEQFRLSYSVNAKGSNFNPPAFEGFQVLTGPNVSSSSSVQIVNGKMTKSASYIYNYILVGYEGGKFSIPPAGIEIKSKEYKSNALSVEVVKGQTAATSNKKAASSPAAVSSGGKDLFATLTVDKKSVYQGEKLIASIKIYTRVDIGGFEDYKFPPYSGFWSQDLESPTQLAFQRENLNGAIYNVALLKKSLIVPQRSGEITIDPFIATIQVRERVRSTNPFDDFFGGAYKSKPVKVTSKPLKINVKSLPANKPADFNGAVGSLKMVTNISTTTVKANEAVTLKVKISGNGNLKFISAPKIDFPPDIEVYDPKTALNTKVTTNGVIGSVSFDYLFIPRYAGTYRIAPITFTYFDLQSKSYKTLRSQEYEIVVEKGVGGEELSSGVVQGFTKEDVKLLGKDIRFIKTGFEVQRKQGILFGSTLFWLVYVISMLLFIVIILVRRVQIQQNANQARVKNRKANKRSKKRLKLAASHMKNNESEKFYDEVLKATWGYLSDKLSIPIAELSKDNVSEILSLHNVDEEGVKELMSLLDSCEFARYAPSAVSGGMDEIFKKAVDLISKLDQKIRK